MTTWGSFYQSNFGFTATKQIHAEAVRFFVRRALALALAVLATVLLSGVSPVAAGDPEFGVDRPGSDYQPPIELQPKQGSFLTYEMECQGLCAKDERCFAWTMVKPGVQGPKAKCYLKNSVPAAKSNACCSSGVADRAAPKPVAAGEPEVGIDRPGSDYQAPIDLQPKQGSFLTYEMECKGLCMNDQRCKAWTMVKPGIQGPKARCYLKSAVPAAKVNSCCSSGVAVRTAQPSPQLDPAIAADRDPRGKTIEQCSAAYQRNQARCMAYGYGTVMFQACNTEVVQIYGACQGLAAQALQTPTPASGVPAEWADMLAAHNETRKRHCAPALTWSAQLASAAQVWANKCSNAHEAQSGQGENLAFFVPSSTNVQAYNDSWACEVQHFDFDNPKWVGGFKNGCDPPVNGHFTQIVWKDTRELGCAKQTCTINGQQGVYTVCRYSPPGNFNVDDINNLRAQVSRPSCQ